MHHPLSIFTRTTRISLSSDKRKRLTSWLSSCKSDIPFLDQANKSYAQLTELKAVLHERTVITQASLRIQQKQCFMVFLWVWWFLIILLMIKIIIMMEQVTC